MPKYKVVCETDKYIIKEIPLNFRIDIKPSLTLINPHTGIERDWYEDIESPLQVAIDLAERVSVEYFRPVTNEEAKANAKWRIKINSAKESKPLARGKAIRQVKVG